MKKFSGILLNAIPVLIMIGLIPLIGNDYLLTALDAIVIVIALVIKRERNDFIFLSFGFVAMIVSESVFISTGVETFQRNSLFGLMPLWLPFLWAYAFVAIKRSIDILNQN